MKAFAFASPTGPRPSKSLRSSRLTSFPCRKPVPLSSKTGSMHIDINCDTGEGIGNDEDLMPYITSASIACGYHTGDGRTMRDTVLLAQEYGVAIGAHPSFQDRDNFGRTEMTCSPPEVYDLVVHQVKLLQQIVYECDAYLHHVKPHGALYNM